MKPLPLVEAIVAELVSLKSGLVAAAETPWDRHHDAVIDGAISIIRKHIAALKVEDVQKRIQDNFQLALSEQSRIAAQSIMSLIRSE